MESVACSRAMIRLDIHVIPQSGFDIVYGCIDPGYFNTHNNVIDSY